MENGRLPISFFVRPTAVPRLHQSISRSRINAKRQIGRTLETQVDDGKEKILLFGSLDFLPRHKKGRVPGPEEEHYRKVQPLLIRTNFEHRVVIGPEA